MARRILIVDDSLTIRQVEKMVLSPAGYDLLEAGDGKDALARLQNTPVNLVLTDINMPTMNGFELLRAIRAHPVHRLTPVVIVTTEAAEDKRKEAKLAGATGWVVKPFTPDQLLAVVTRVLGKEKT